MKRRVYLMGAIIATCLNIARAQEDNIVELDLNTDTLTSTQGADIKYGNMKMKAFNLKRDEAENKVYSPEKIFIEVDGELGKLEVDTESAVVTLDGENGEFSKTFGSVEVGKLTGAEVPNDRIYFGGKSVDYKNNNIYIKNGWATTDPLILKTRDPNLVGYHFLSNSIEIEPDKQMTLKGSDLFIGKTDITPFTLPWFRVNIRRDSMVPLFPTIGTEDEYGINSSWGFLWGDRDSKYVGGFAPKFAEYQGFLIGRWENWYKFDKFGTTKLNIDDLLVYRKNRGADDRWGIEFSHDYIGEYGNFNLDIKNATYNMIPVLNDLIDDYRDQGRFDKKNWNYLGMPDPYKGKAMTFYTLDSNLSVGDTTFKAKVKRVDDLDAYKLIVNDEIDDYRGDYSLLTDVSLYKENEKIKIGGYYTYFYDPAPGGTTKYLKSKAENFGFEAIDKEKKLSLKYDEKNEDKYRTLSLWERNLNLNRRWLGTATTLLGDYEIYTIPQYDIYDSKNFNLSVGDYKVNEGLKYKVGYRYDSSEKKLSLLEDPFRKNLISGNERDKQFNRYENIIYEDVMEQEGYINLNTSWATLTLSGGHTREEFWDRRGLYDGSYIKYKNISDFFKVGATTPTYYLGQNSEFKYSASVRYDDYTNGGNGDDSSLYTKLGGEYTQLLGKNIENELKYDYGHYNYSGNNLKMQRLRNKYNTQKVQDKIEWEMDDKKINYQVTYEEKDRAYNNHLANKIFKNELNIQPLEKVILKLDYSFDKRYDDETRSGKNYNDLKYENYGTSLKIKNHRVYYKNTKIDARVWDIAEIDDSLERIREDRYGYEYSKNLNKLNLEYAQATDKRENYTLNKREIGLKNELYKVSYLIDGDQQHKITGTYEKDNSEQNRNLSSDEIYLSYDYKNKKFNEVDIENYAEKEFGKKAEELTQAELDEVKTMLVDRQNAQQAMHFDLRRTMEKRIGGGDYKEAFFTSLKLQRNQKRYEQTGNYLQSLQEAEMKLYYAYNRYGVGYEYSQTSGYSGSSWRDYEKDHKVSLHAKIGRPSEGWRLKTYAKFYDGLKGTTTTDKRKRMDGIGVEIGKEMGYYEWSVAFLKEYSVSKKDYEWQAALQFKLLTFPDVNIFGIGANRKGWKEDRKTNPSASLFDGIKIKDYMDD